MKKEYKKASMEMVNLSDDDLDSVSGGVGNAEEMVTDQVEKEEKEDFFSAGFMGMCSGYEQQSVQHEETHQETQETQEAIREDCFAYGFMGMCSGYEQSQTSSVQTNQETQTNMAEECITYGFMDMCSGYELAGNLNQTSTQEASENPSAAPDSQQTSSTGSTFYEDEL